MQITKENLTIIIVTIKSQNIIDDCLQSIDPEVKKIIVENSSDQELKFEHVVSYQSSE